MLAAQLLEAAGLEKASADAARREGLAAATAPARAADEPAVRFGRTVVSETELPNMVANLV